MYEYQCESCKKTFEKLVPLSNRDAVQACPECGSKKTSRQLSAVMVGGESKSTSLPVSGGGCRCSGPGPCGH